jgi:hypothetical protein
LVLKQLPTGEAALVERQFNTASPTPAGADGGRPRGWKRDEVSLAEQPFIHARTLRSQQLEARQFDTASPTPAGADGGRPRGWKRDEVNPACPSSQL